MKQESKIQLTPEEELQVLIDKAKKKHGRIYKTIIADEVIIWRLLKRSEFKDVMNKVVYRQEFAEDENGNLIYDENGNNVMIDVQDEDLTYEMRQEEIAKAVILYPQGIVENMAAVAEIISTECMIKSGFGEAPVTEQC
jgi:hypothetical protein